MLQISSEMPDTLSCNGSFRRNRLMTVIHELTDMQLLNGFSGLVKEQSEILGSRYVEKMEFLQYPENSEPQV